MFGLRMNSWPLKSKSSACKFLSKMVPFQSSFEIGHAKVTGAVEVISSVLYYLLPF